MRYSLYPATGVLAVALMGCSAGAAPDPAVVPPTPVTPSVTPSATPGSAQTPAVTVPQVTGRPLTMADATRCPVTRPGPFVPPSGVSHDELFGAGASHGNDKLWVGGLWDNGVIAVGPDFISHDGSVGMKFGWYRIAPGTLSITGRRLDGPAPPATGNVPDGYGPSGFQATGVSFPTEGCWEITGRVGPASLTFVTFVIKR